jgi:tRNA A37 N6-isopentenylltransferase MiaA
VDPKQAEYLHTKDTRRVINALVRHFKNSPGGGGGQMLLRYYPVMVWLRASPGVLEDRIGRRIGQMIGEQGGLDEIISLFDAHHPTSAEPLDFEKGLLQAIGYKEFYPYYLLLKSGVPPTEDDLQQAKARLQQKTIEYTKYQIKWLEKRIGRGFAGGGLLLRVELDDPEEYESKALVRALEHF